MFGNYFTEHTIRVVPSYENTMAKYLSIAAGKFINSTIGQKKYKVDIVNRPSILDNSKYWHIFEDDTHIKRFLELFGEFIKRFLELSGEFVNKQVDNENENLDNFQDAKESE